MVKDMLSLDWRNVWLGVLLLPLFYLFILFVLEPIGFFIPIRWANETAGSLGGLLMWTIYYIAFYILGGTASYLMGNIKNGKD